MANSKLNGAKRAKKDEFYTQYSDVEREMSAYVEHNPDLFQNKTVLLPCDDPYWSNFTRYFTDNFEKLGIRKLISTSLAPQSNPAYETLEDYEAVFGTVPTDVGKDKYWARGKRYVIERGHEPQVQALEGDGDFRSDEVTRLRDEADFVITNPPFSLFREFLAWVLESDVCFSVVGNQNLLTKKDIFPYVKSGDVWLGNGFKSLVGYFKSPYEDTATCTQRKEGLIRVSGVVWYTNIPHGRRFELLGLNSYAYNLENGSKKIREARYPCYDNYEAIEVCETSGIPSDYSGVMGVPITFLDKYNPNQFEILGCSDGSAVPDEYKIDHPNGHQAPIVNGKNKYSRIFIKHRTSYLDNTLE